MSVRGLASELGISAALLLCSVVASQTIPATTFETFRTPDGSRFLLVPDDSSEPAAIVHWAVVTPVGLAEDSPRSEGLARAVARASLNGTSRHGSSDSARESAALRALDSLQRRAIEARRRGETIPEELAAELAAAEQTAAELGDPTAWLTAVRTCPAEIAVRERDESFVLRVTMPTESMPGVALLLLDRRENARLRGLRTEYEQVRAELGGARQGPIDIVRREVLGLAYLGSPSATTIDAEAASFTRDEALELHRQIQQPERSYHVITGGFDPAEVRALLAAVFARSSIRALPAPSIPRPAQGRQRASTIPTNGAEAYALAVPVPPSADDRELAILGRLVARGRWSRQGRALHKSASRDFDLGFTVPFPQDRRPGMFLIEIREIAAPAADAPPVPPWPELVRAAIRDIESAGLTDEQVDRASQQVAGRIAIARSSPGRLAFDLADWCGVRGIDPAVALGSLPRTDVAAIRALARQMFVDGPRVEVSLERPR